MVLMDDSVCVDHLRAGDDHLKILLEEGEVLCHPFVLGELACGNIANWEEILALLQALPGAQKVDEEEVLAFIEAHRLMGVGLGLIDVHLLASAVLSRATLWTTARQLRTASAGLKFRYK